VDIGHKAGHDELAKEIAPKGAISMLGRETMAISRWFRR
jgi:hypothetical protein